ncbi:DUF4145 domain-containing protein [Marivita hallyeonensis]|uniref:DUF4145 domain-containing protein n=1 Tax=Marivita hallyeonensis TaxID=996342 RepID=A0A1M5X760_9RHOB|nr:DUF4145 domain-containing protein [Marivita hallyeonensis]SHH95334.1 protein of unknown function [Marivita hallyeonensis]
MKELLFENPNIFQADDRVRLVDSHNQQPLSLRCPHCLHVGTFGAIREGLGWTKYQIDHSRTKGRSMYGFIRVCPNTECNGIVFTVSSGTDYVNVSPPELIDFDAKNLPKKLLSTLEEAISCHAAKAYRASAMMVRRLLEEICDESGAEGKDLHTRLVSLRSKVTLPDELFDAMTELKALGNDAAHITAKNYIQIGKDESEDSIELAKEILKARYQLKGLVDRLRARKAKSSDAK